MVLRGYGGSDACGYMFSWFGGRLDFGMLRDARSTICYRATRISPWRASAHSNSTRHQQAPQHHLRPQGGFGQLWDYGRGTSSTTGEPALNGSALAPERFADIIATGTASPPVANRKTKSQLASSKTSTTKYASSSDAAAGCATTNVSASRFSPCMLPPLCPPKNHPLDSLNTKFIDLYY